MISTALHPAEPKLPPSAALVSSSPASSTVGTDPSASLTYGLRAPAPELLVLAEPPAQPAPAKKAPSQKPGSYVQTELAEIRRLLESSSTKVLERLVEENERQLERSEKALADAQARYDRSGFLDWLTGRTKGLREALAESQADYLSATFAASNASRMSQRLDGVLDLLSKSQLTLAVQQLEYLKKSHSEELYVDEPIRRLKALLARP